MRPPIYHRDQFVHNLCRTCGARIRGDGKDVPEICHACNVDLIPEGEAETRCKRCGTRLRPGVSRCRHCAADLGRLAWLRSNVPVIGIVIALFAASPTLGPLLWRKIVGFEVDFLVSNMRLHEDHVALTLINLGTLHGSVHPVLECQGLTGQLEHFDLVFTAHSAPLIWGSEPVPIRFDELELVRRTGHEIQGGSGSSSIDLIAQTARGIFPLLAALSEPAILPIYGLDIEEGVLPIAETVRLSNDDQLGNSVQPTVSNEKADIGRQTVHFSCGLQSEQLNPPRSLLGSENRDAAFTLSFHANGSVTVIDQLDEMTVNP